MDLQAVEVALSGVAWFVAVMWLNFVGRPQLGLTVVIVTGMLVMFLTFLLLAISMVIDDPRWRLARVESGRYRIAAGECRSSSCFGPWNARVQFLSEWFNALCPQ